MLHYHVAIADQQAHLFRVQLTIPAHAGIQHQLRLPAWIPGSYMIRDFSRHLIDLQASADGQPLAIQIIDKQTWQLAPSDQQIQVSYLVYAYDLSVRSAYLDDEFGFFNFTSLCLQVDQHAELPCEVSIDAPAHWQLATGLPRLHGETWRSGRFRAEHYQHLIDHPVLMGELSIATFSAGNIPHALVLAGRHYTDLARITADLKRICDRQIALFGQAPFDRYLFLTMVVGRGFGGLEHGNSTALLCSRKDLPVPQKSAIDHDYRTFLSLCSHEYFHSWNVKTLKPKLFLPYQLHAEQYTPQLWFYEGFTSYYDDYLLHQAGIIDAQQYLNIVAETLAKAQRGKGWQRQSVADSSRFAWNKYYKQDENSPNAIVSYYAKGGLIALCIDLQMRLQSNHQVTLDTAMAAFWQRFGATGAGTDDDSFADFIASEYQLPVADFIRQAPYQSGDLPVLELLSQFGISHRWQAASDDNNFTAKGQGPLPVSFGAKYKATAQGLELTHVYEGEAAAAAGLSAHDRIIAIDGLQVTDGTIREILERMQPGQRTPIHAFHRDRLLTLEICWQAPKLQVLQLSINAAEQLAGWLQPVKATH